MMRKKTYFIGVTHEIETIKTILSGFLVSVKFIQSILLKNPIIGLGLVHLKQFILLQPIPEF